MKFKSLEVLKKNVEDFKKALLWLEKSVSKCERLRGKLFEELKDEEVESIEALFSRYSRCVDLLINRVLRSLEIAELGDVIISKLDIVISAEKKGFVENYEELIALKDLRNELAHEYIGDMVMEKFDEVWENSVKLIEISGKVLNYIETQVFSYLRKREKNE